MKMKALLFLLGTCLLATAAQASVQDVRLVGVGVDTSSRRAYEEALDYAKKRAVYLVARKLPIDDPSAKVAALPPEDYARIVRGATVLNSKRKGERTYLDVTVTIVDSELRSILNVKDSGARDGERTAPLRTLVVMPVLVRDDKAYLWQKENDLRAPLQRELLRQAQGALIVPAGDTNDLRLIDHNNALTVTGPELKPMFERYGVSEIIIAIYTLPVDKKPGSILLRRLSAEVTRSEVIKLATDEDGQRRPVDVLLHQASQAIATALVQIASSSGDEERARLAKAKKIKLNFLYANPRELASMQEAVRDNKDVLLLEIPSIAVNGIGGVAYLEGEPQKLRESLVKAAIIVRQKDDLWQLSYR